MIIKNHKTNLRRLIVLLVFGICLSSCSSPLPEINSGSDSETVLDSGFVLSAKVIENAGVEYGSIEPVLLSHDVNAQGKIMALPSKTASVSVMVAGSIQSINVRFGQAVNKGQVLATYSSHELLEMQQMYLNSKYKLEKVKQEFEREESLWKKNVISEKVYQSVLMNYNLANADYQTSLAEMKLLNFNMKMLDQGEVSTTIPILSPIQGVVEEIKLSIGKFVHMGDEIFRIIDKVEPTLQLMIFEKDIHFVETGQRVTFSISGMEKGEFEGVIFNVGSIVDQNARIIKAMAHISSNGQPMAPGMFVSSTIHTGEKLLNALPESAIVVESDDRKYGFYTLDDSDSKELSFFMFSLKTGFTEDGFVEVFPDFPIPQGGRIVVSGTYYLKSEMIKRLGE